MCIIFLSINQHPKYPLIIAANRDEFFCRPTASAHYWSKEEGGNITVFGGIYYLHTLIPFFPKMSKINIE